MIEALMQFGNDEVIAHVEGNSLWFIDPGEKIGAPLEGIRLNKSEVIKTFPDLENDEEWKAKAFERLKTHIKNFKTEDEKINYVIKELQKTGYVGKFKQKAGFRPTKIINEVING